MSQKVGISVHAIGGQHGSTAFPNEDGRGNKSGNIVDDDYWVDPSDIIIL